MPRIVFRYVVARLGTMQTEQLLCWSGMTDTEHTTSGSNEEEEGYLHTCSKMTSIRQSANIIVL